MESLVGPSAVATSSASSPFSIFSPKAPFTRRLRILPIASKGREDEHEDEHEYSLEPGTSIVPILRNQGSLSRLSKDDAMGLVLSAAAGTGWTTGSGMEGPAVPASGSEQDSSQVSTFPWSLFTKSPRRRMRVAFTCNVCGQRTTRAINPHAYTDGTVFVQCCGCNVFHKLVDNLNLFHEMKCYVNPSFRYKGDAPFSYWDGDAGSDNMFPLP